MSNVGANTASVSCDCRVRPRAFAGLSVSQTAGFWQGRVQCGRGSTGSEPWLPSGLEQVWAGLASAGMLANPPVSSWATTVGTGETRTEHSCLLISFFNIYLTSNLAGSTLSISVNS